MPDGVVERYLEALVARDWETFAACLTDGDFVRVGPYRDTYTSKAEYVEFISGLLPQLPDYVMQVTRITPNAAGTVVFVELNETVTMNGGPFNTPECITFDLADDGRIAAIKVFIQTVPPRP